jgi:hypothetical protein
MPWHATNDARRNIGFTKSETPLPGTPGPATCFFRPRAEQVGGLTRLNLKYHRVEEKGENERPGSGSYRKRLVQKMQIQKTRPRRTFYPRRALCN